MCKFTKNRQVGSSDMFSFCTLKTSHGTLPVAVENQPGAAQAAQST